MDAWEVLIYGKDLSGIFQELLGFCCCVYGQRKIQFCVLQPPASLWQDLSGAFYELIEFPVFQCLFYLPSSFLGFFWESQARLSFWDGAVGRGQQTLKFRLSFLKVQKPLPVQMWSQMCPAVMAGRAPGAGFT